MGTQEIPNSPASDQIIGNSTIRNSTTVNSTTVNSTTVNSTTVNLTTMRSEAQRLSTFTSWPHNDKVEARKIAKAGFFHTGIDSEVKCLWCETVLNEWEYGDQVMARHRSANPDCPFIRNISDNVPLLASSSNNESQQLHSGLNSTSQASQSQESQDDTDTPMEAQNMNDSGVDETMTLDTTRPSQRQVPTVSRTPDLQQFRSEASRLETFRSWTHRYPMPADLANAGFIFTGSTNRPDLVRCVFCGQYVGNWEEEDFPITEHRSLFPECPFIQGQEVGNIPLSQFPGFISTPMHPTFASPGVSRMQDESIDETGVREPEDSFDVTGVQPRGGRDANSGPEKRSPNVQLFNGKPDDPSLNIIRHTGPASTKYSTLEARLRTFKDWPPALKQEPRQLADAGFYYIGLSDQTKCFYCEGGLRNWQPDDDPWTEHARWFTKCGYVRLIKGDEFIAKCVDEIPTEIPPKDRDNTSARLSEDDLKSMMSTSMVQEVLAMKIPQSRVEMALKQRGKLGYPSANELASAALSVQLEQTRIIPDPRAASTSTSESQQPTSSSTVHSKQAHTNVSVPGSSSCTPNPPQQQPCSEPQITPMTSTVPPGVEDAGSPRLDDPAGGSTSAQVAQASKNPMDLEQENQRLKEAQTCKICMDNQIGVVFLPCGHFICCVKCAPSLRDCPYCRQSIHGTVKTYMS